MQNAAEKLRGAGLYLKASWVDQVRPPLISTCLAGCAVGWVRRAGAGGPRRPRWLRSARRTLDDHVPLGVPLAIRRMS